LGFESDPDARNPEIDMPKSPTYRRRATVVEFEHGKLPYSHTESRTFLDVAKNLHVPLEHACGGSARARLPRDHPRRRAELSEMQDDEAIVSTPRGIDGAIGLGWPGRHFRRRRLRAAM